MAPRSQSWVLYKSAVKVLQGYSLIWGLEGEESVPCSLVAAFSSLLAVGLRISGPSGLLARGCSFLPRGPCLHNWLVPQCQ